MCLCECGQFHKPKPEESQLGGWGVAIIIIIIIIIMIIIIIIIIVTNSTALCGVLAFFNSSLFNPFHTVT
jgi:hypothetical protein